MSASELAEPLDFLAHVAHEARGCVVCHLPRPAALPKSWRIGIFVPPDPAALAGLPFVGYVVCPECFALPDLHERAEAGITAEMEPVA